MAATTVNTDVYAARVADPPTILKGSVIDGRMKRIVCKITPGAVETGSTINICIPPVGARLSSLSKVLFEAFGAGATLAIGIAGETGKFKAAADVAAIGNFNLDLLAGVDYVFDGVVALIGTTGGATYAAAKALVFEMVFANFN